MIEVLGFDPGLRKGSLVKGFFAQEEDQLVLKKYDVLYSWDDKSLGKKSTPEDLMTFVHHRLLESIQGPVISATIEWDPNSVYWKVQRLQVVVTSFLIGYLSRGIHSMGIPVYYLTPAQLKKIFSISPKEKKKEYMSKGILLKNFISEVGSPTNPDDYDALLLSISSALRIYDPRTFSSLLSGE